MDAGRFTQVPAELFGYEGLSPADKFVYVALLSYAWKKDHCTPAIDSLAMRAGCSPSTVKRALKALQDAGLVEVEQQYNAKGQANSRYRLALTVAPKTHTARRRTAQPTRDVPARIDEESWAGFDGVEIYRDDTRRELPPVGDFDNLPF